jgi:hypothetical protein
VHITHWCFVTPDPAFHFPFVWTCSLCALSPSWFLLPRPRRCSALTYPDLGHFAGVLRRVQSPVRNQNLFMFLFGFRNCCGLGIGKCCLFWRHLGLVILFSICYGCLIVSFWGCPNGNYYGERKYFLRMLGLKLIAELVSLCLDFAAVWWRHCYELHNLESVYLSVCVLETQLYGVGSSTCAPDCYTLLAWQACISCVDQSNSHCGNPPYGEYCCSIWSLLLDIWVWRRFHINQLLFAIVLTFCILSVSVTIYLFCWDLLYAFLGFVLKTICTRPASLR